MQYWCHTTTPEDTMQTMTARQIIAATEKYNGTHKLCWADASHGWNNVKAAGTVDFGRLIGVKPACQDCIDAATPAAVDAGIPAASAPKKTSIRFETTECGRCSGGGTYPSLVDNGRCFTCSGTGKVLSRNGKAARKAYDAAIAERCTVDLADLKPGDVVWHYRSTAAMETRKGWVTVESVTPDTLNAGRLIMKVRGALGVNATPEYKVRISRPEVTREIIENVARRFKGATLLVDGVEQSSEVAKLIRKAVNLKF
jgi:hypothetical protein